METCGLPIDQLFQFCDIHTLRVLRRTCRTYRSEIPIGWTKDYLFVTDHPSKKGIDSEALQRYQDTCTSVHTLTLTKVQLTGTLRLSPVMSQLKEFNLVHARELQRLEFHPNHQNLRTILMYDSAFVTDLVVPNDCTKLEELTLSSLSLSHQRWTFQPGWHALRVVSFVNVGSFPHISFPASYTNLEHVHIADVGLTRLELQMDLSTREELFDRLTLRLHERWVDSPNIHIVTASTNQPWLHILSNCATTWVLQ